jgi:glycosyltransferase involved in cell wall biosynthesis
MPAYNEAPYLAAAVREVANGLRDRDELFELIVVENGSTDDTVRVLRGLEDEIPEVRGLSLPEANYGCALRAGVSDAQGHQVAIFDVDYYDLAFLKEALGRLTAPDAAAIVVGSKRGAGAADHRPWQRRAITSIFTAVMKVVFGLNGPDTHGIKALDAGKTGHLVAACKLNYDLFDSELVLRAERAGLAVEYLPVEVREMRAPRSSVMRRIPRTLLGLARLRWTLWRESA